MAAEAGHLQLGFPLVRLVPDKIAAEPDARVVVNEGRRWAFSAGHDLGEMVDSGDEASRPSAWTSCSSSWVAALESAAWARRAPARGPKEARDRTHR